MSRRCGTSFGEREHQPKTGKTRRRALPQRFNCRNASERLGRSAAPRRPHLSSWVRSTFEAVSIRWIFPPRWGLTADCPAAHERALRALKRFQKMRLLKRSVAGRCLPKAGQWRPRWSSLQEREPTKADAVDALGRGRGLDHCDELFRLIALGAGENNEFVDLVEDGAALRGSGDGDPATTPKLQ